MKIYPIAPNLNAYANSKTRNNPLKPLEADSFVSSKKQLAFTSRANESKFAKKIINSVSNALLSRYKRFSKSDFQNLSKPQYCILKHASEGFYNDALEAVVDSSKVVKNVFDKKYGRDNYVFVSVGRSLECIQNALDYMGVKTKILPISGLHTTYPSAQKIMEQQGFNKYLKYIKDTVLNGESTQKSGKKYLFCDYCVTGNTLDTIKEIIQSPKVGLKSENAEFIDFVKLYEDAYYSLKSKPKTSPELFRLHLGYEYFKMFSATKFLSANKLEKVYDSVNCAQSYQSKLFNFRLMDAFMDK